MNAERWWVLYHACSIEEPDDWNEFVRAFNIAHTHVWHPGSNQCGKGINAIFDESLPPYQPHGSVKRLFRDTPFEIPVTYMPRKPDPNGLLRLIVLSCSTSTHT